MTTADPDTLKAFLEKRALAEADLLSKLAPYNIDLLVLAGFMRVFTPYFIDGLNTGSLPLG